MMTNESAFTKLFPNYKSVEFDMPDGKTIKIETGKLANQAHGAVLVTCGNTVLMATVVSAYEPKENASFFPLTVDYQENYSAAGKIPGGFFKREGRLSSYEILTSRLVDRALRPMFPDNYYHETQVLVKLMSYDKNDVFPDALAAFAASSAIMASDIPFNGPISEVRVARVNGEFKLNPNFQEMEESDMEMIVAATIDNVVMVEGEMKEVSEAEMVEAIKVAHEAIKLQCKAQIELMEASGNTVKRSLVPQEENEEVKARVEALAKEKIYEVARGAYSKVERSEKLKAIKEEVKALYEDDEESEELELAMRYYKNLEKEVIREVILKEKRRLDGRGLEEIRPLYMEIDVLPRTHGSALFTRGETQVLASTTLGNKLDEQMIDNATYKGFEDFILHYNFPPFSTGETKPMRGPARREIGHGNLAHRSLKQVMPNSEENPYTVRIVADVLESNGSSSMASVCGGSLALMDAGIKIKSHVSGIAMGLISGENGEVAVLTDILGDEDHLGDMDFKVTGTRKGICACQMDIKVEGLSYEILGQALEQARRARLEILDKMYEVIDQPRYEFKPFVPRIHKIFIARDFIGAVIGPGGSTIQEMQRETGTTITIDEVGDQGEIVISGDDKDSIEAAIEKIKAITAVPQTGEVYEAKVKSIMPYGAFVEFLPGKEGLLHISEISWSRIEKVEDVLKVGDMIKVKLLDIDKRSGKFKLSRKVLLEPPAHVKEKMEKRDSGQHE